MPETSVTQVIISAASATVALASLGLSVYTGWVTRCHYKNTLRPIINVDIDISPVNGRYVIALHNCGPGVAIIKHWAPTIAGLNPESLEKMTSRKLTDVLGYSSLIDFTHYFPEDALQAGERMEIIGTKPKQGTEEECKTFKYCLKRVKIDFSYSSVYGDVWDKCFDGNKEFSEA